MTCILYEGGVCFLSVMELDGEQNIFAITPEIHKIKYEILQNSPRYFW